MRFPYGLQRKETKFFRGAKRAMKKCFPLKTMKDERPGSEEKQIFLPFPALRN